MGKIIELIIILGLLVFSFFSGVKYSDNVKEHASWLFEDKEGEADALPEGTSEETVPAGEGVSTFTDPAAADSDSLVQPEVAPTAPTAAPTAPAAPVAPVAAPVAPTAPAAAK